MFRNLNNLIFFEVAENFIFILNILFQNKLIIINQIKFLLLLLFTFLIILKKTKKKK
jgi:hypothetical protein